MLALDWLAQPTSRLISLTLLHFIWQGFFVAALLWLFVETCRIRRTTSRYACSLAALVAMTLLPLATLCSLFMNYSRGVNRWPIPSELVSPPRIAAASWPSAWIEVTEPYLLAIWLLGVALFGGRLLMGALGIARLRRGHLPLPSELSPTIERLGRRMQISAAS